MKKMSECQLDKFFVDLTSEKRTDLKNKLRMDLIKMMQLNREDEADNIRFMMKRL